MYTQTLHCWVLNQICQTLSRHFLAIFMPEKCNIKCRSLVLKQTDIVSLPLAQLSLLRDTHYNEQCKCLYDIFSAVRWPCSTMPRTTPPVHKSVSPIVQSLSHTTPTGTECDHSLGIPPFLYSHNLGTEYDINLVGNR